MGKKVTAIYWEIRILSREYVPLKLKPNMTKKWVKDLDWAIKKSVTPCFNNTCWINNCCEGWRRTRGVDIWEVVVKGIRAMGSGLALKEVLDADYTPKHRKNMEV